MPEYTFYCDIKKGGCDHHFTLIMLMCDYSPRQVCPKCRKIEPVCRNYQEDLAQGQVVKGDDEITLGQLAQRNTERMSKDEREALTRKHNAYKENKPYPELPPGMSWPTKGD
jgi:hypothetical protein